jgi:hypothetical protein
MLNRFQFVEHRGHRLWTVDDEVQPATYVRYLLSRQHSREKTSRIMRAFPITSKPLVVPLTTLVRRGKVIGFRVPTWVGVRFGTSDEVCRSFRAEGYTKRELDSLFAIAKRERIKQPIDHLLAHGIRP